MNLTRANHRGKVERLIAGRLACALAVLAASALLLGFAGSAAARPAAVRLPHGRQVALAGNQPAPWRRHRVTRHHAVGGKPGRGVKPASPGPGGGSTPSSPAGAPSLFGAPAPTGAAATEPSEAAVQGAQAPERAPPLEHGTEMEPPAAEEPEPPSTGEPSSPPEEPEAPAETPKSPPEEPKSPPEEPKAPPEEPKAPPEEPKAPENPPETPESPPEQPSEPEQPPPSAGLLFSGSTIDDFAAVQAAPGAVTEVPDPLGSGQTVLRLTVDDGDVAPITPTENPRAQLVSPDLVKPGQEFWLKTKFLIPQGFPTVTGWMSVLSIYGPPFNASSPWQIEVLGEHLQWTRNRTYGFDVPWQAPLIKGAWVTVLTHERFAADGFIEMWIDGQQVSFFGKEARLNMKTMDSSNDGGLNSIRISQYREAGMFKTGTVYFGPVRFGATRDAVGG